MPSNTASDILGGATIFTIVVGILIGIAIIVIGMRLKRRRVAGEKELIERREAAHLEAAPVEPGAAIDAKAEAEAAKSVGKAETPSSPDKASLPATSEPAAEVLPATVKAEPEPPAAPKGEHVPAMGGGDITQLKGLGPKLAATLAERGYTRLEQIAALTPDQAAELDAQLGTFQGRLARDRWIEQAKLLIAGDRAAYEAAFGKLG